MSHVRGKDPLQAGKFAFTCYDWQGNVYAAQGGFNTAQEADNAAACAERAMTIAAMCPTPIDDDIFNMSDDELLEMLKG